jgi:hypothetical protein
MSTNLIIGKDVNGAIDDAIPVSQNIYAITLTASTAASIIVPANVDVAYFSYGGSGDVWVNMSGAATIPGSLFVQTKSELNPVARYVIPGETISFICSAINPVEVAFYNSRNI